MSPPFRLSRTHARGRGPVPRAAVLPLAVAPLAAAAWTLAACASGTASRRVATTTTTVVAAPVRGTFTLVRGADTIGTETFTRGADRLEATFAAGRRSLFRYDAALRPDAGTARIAVTPLAPAVAAAAPSASATFAGDSVTVRQDGAAGGPATTARRAAPPGTVAYVNPSPSLMEQIVRRARALGGAPGGAPVAVPVFVSGTGGVGQTATVAFLAPDSARLDLAGVALRFRVDPAGAVLGGTVPAQGLTIVRSGAP